MVARVSAASVSVLACALIIGAAAAWGWETIVKGDRDAAAGFVGIDAADDVLAAGSVDQQLTVLKLRADDGAQAWRYQWPQQEGDVSAVAGFALLGGDVVIAGFTGPARGVVMRISGEDGHEQWRWSGPGQFGYAEVAVDHAGNVIVSMPGDEPGPLTIVKYSGSDGLELWRHTEPMTYSGDIAIDGADNIVAASTPLVSLSGATGQVLWSRNGGGRAGDVLIAPTGDAIASAFMPRGRTASFVELTSLFAVTGKPRWRTRRSRSFYPLVLAPSGRLFSITARYRPYRADTLRDALFALSVRDGHRIPGWSVQFPAGSYVGLAAVDPAGNVIVSSTWLNGGAGQYPPENSFVTKIRSETGTRAWRQDFATFAQTPYGFVGEAIQTDQKGDVIVAGYGRTPTDTFAVVKLSGTTGEDYRAP